MRTDWGAPQSLAVCVMVYRHIFLIEWKLILIIISISFLIIEVSMTQLTNKNNDETYCVI